MQFDPEKEYMRQHIKKLESDLAERDATITNLRSEINILRATVMSPRNSPFGKYGNVWGEK